MKLLSLKDEINAAMASLKPSVWPIYAETGETKFLDRSEVMTASEAASCVRKLWYDKNTAPTVGETASEAVEKWGFFERGHNVEAWVVQKLKDAGADTEFTGEGQVSFVNGLLSGTPDGVMFLATGSPVLLEFKSMDPRTSTRYLPKPVHITQCQVNMGLVRDALYPDMVSATILYVNASDYQDMYEFNIEFDPAVYQQAKEKAASLFSADGPDELPPEGVTRKKATGGCTYCEHTAKCSAAVQANKEVQQMHEKHAKLANKVF